MKTSKFLIMLPALALLAASISTTAVAGGPGRGRAGDNGTFIKQKWTPTLGRMHTPGASGFHTLAREDFARRVNLQPGKTYRLKDGDYVFRGTPGNAKTNGLPGYRLWKFDRVPAPKAKAPASSGPSGARAGAASAGRALGGARGGNAGSCLTGGSGH